MAPSRVRRRLHELPLHAYRPRPALRVDEHAVTRARFPAVDAHNHLGRWLTRDRHWAVSDVGELLALMDTSNVRSIVNLDGLFGEELEANLERYDRAHPGRFATFCHVDWRKTADAGSGERLPASLRRSVAAGAKGLKVWKDLGLHVRDERGDLLMPADPRLSDVWDTAAELGVPVAIHTADPLAFFDPVDATNERLEELLEHPDWSFADRGRFPRFELLIGSLEKLVADHQGTTFIGVHVGGFAEDLGWVGRMLDTYPNFHVDIAARISELGRQPRAARRLLLEHPSRVLFGTDEFPPDPRAYAISFRFLETGDEHFAYSPEPVPAQGRWAISGLDLPDHVLDLVYSGNAVRLIPGIAT